MDIIKGYISGMVGVLISYPMDTIKTNIQSKVKPTYTLSALYRGITPQLFGVGLEKSLVFGIYNNLPKQNNILNIFLNGAITGFFTSIIITPIEKIKIIMQNNKDIKYTYNLKYYFRGIVPTICRETTGFAIYFSNYEYWKNKLYTQKNEKISLLGSFLIGGSSGLVSWIVICPIDAVKTRMQITNNISTLNIIKELYKNKEFYKSFPYVIMRAIPLHAGAFMTMEFLSR